MTRSAAVILCMTALLMVQHALRSFAESVAGGSLNPSQLRCECLIDPLGIGQPAPRLSWVLESNARRDRQSGYQVMVASTADLLGQNKGDLWDSQKIDSSESAHVVYSGRPLVSRSSCFWKVRVWSALSGQPSAWSKTAYWTIGLLEQKDWSAHWIDTHHAVEQEIGSDPIKITRAIYMPVPKAATTRGVATTTPVSQPIDVTSKLAGLVQDGWLKLVVNNTTMGGDPQASLHKQLQVKYEHGGKSFETTVAENKTLSIPELPTQLWYLRKAFSARGPARQATLYVTALGLYEIHLNGQRVGDHLLAPDWTDYKKRLGYQAFDVTSLLAAGPNALAAVLANGWYAGHIGNGGFEYYGREPALLAQLEITYADGSVERVVTDQTWKIKHSPVLSSDFMLGENYDARAEISDWDQPVLNDKDWEAASLRKEIFVPLESQVCPPVRQTQLIKPIAVKQAIPGRWTFDLGQNMVGVVRLKISEPAGTVITLHHAEMLNPDGSVYTTNLRGAPSLDSYTCKGSGIEIWQPSFTFHGFRYVELTGLTDKPMPDAVTGVVMGSDTPRTGSFECSDLRINQLLSNIQWGQRGNYLSIPTDCPQRDERLGWMGDAQVFVRTATDNADVSSFFTKWLVDVDDAQDAQGAFADVSPRTWPGGGTPAWGDAGVICPWTLYLAYGDKYILLQHLPSMTKWVEWCRNNSTNLIRDKQDKRGGDYGDWLSIKAVTPKDLIGTAYFAYTTHLLANAYEAVGDTPQSAKYNDLFQQIKIAFNKKYVAADGRIAGNTQCAYLMALKFNLLSTELRSKAVQYLLDDIKAKDWHLSTGFVGVSYLLPMLSESNHADVAYKLLMQDTFPSWLFSVKHGATTIWERWDGWTPDKGFQDPEMNSFNHYSLGSCGEWLYDTVAGITWDPAQPGYKHMIIHPIPGGGLTFAKATIGSPYGNISSAWTKTTTRFELKIRVPANTMAEVFMPAQASDVISESGKPADHQEGITRLRKEGGSVVYQVESGEYDFSVSHAPN